MKPHPLLSMMKRLAAYVTERTRAEAALRSAPGDLEQRLVRKRTVELRQTNEDLQRQIAERKRTEESLRRAHAKTDVLLSSVPSILIGVNSEGFLAYWNTVAEAMFGIASADVINKPLSECGIQWDSAVVLAGIAECRTADRQIRLDNVRFQYPDGSARYLGFTVVPIRAENGRDLEVLLFGADITERKRAEIALRRQAALTHLVQLVAVAANEAKHAEEAMQVCVDQVCASTSWPIGHVYMSPVTGHLVPASVRHLNNPQREEAFLKMVQAVRYAPGVGLPGRVLITKKPVWSLEVTKDMGGLLAVAAQERGIQAAFAFPVLVGEEVVAVLEFFSLEAQEPDAQVVEVMAHIGAQLGRVVERQRVQEELRENNIRLTELTALKDEFIAKVSHELRTPLTSIKEGLNLLIDNALGQTTAEQQDFLKTMDQDLDRLAELITNMLDISTIEAGCMRLARTRVGVRALIDSLVRSCRPILGHRAVQTAFDEVPPIFGDPNRLLQVFTNLFSNAIKFTPDDGTITLRAERRNGEVAIVVEDNGPGIALEDLSKLFQKFSQVGPQGAGHPRGTGLGLVVCKELTELHGGRIDVASEIGRGTTFTVLLPVYTDALALKEGFQELLESASSDEERTVGLITIRVDALLTTPGAQDQQRERLQRVADDARRHLHRGDIVLAIEPAWVVVLAVTDAAGVRAIVTRLRDILHGGDRLRFGAAVYPHDGADATTLFERATRMLNQGLASLVQPHDATKAARESV